MGVRVIRYRARAGIVMARCGVRTVVPWQLPSVIGGSMVAGRVFVRCVLVLRMFSWSVVIGWGMTTRR